MHDAKTDDGNQGGPSLPDDAAAASLGVAAEPDERTDASGIAAADRAMAKRAVSMHGRPLQLAPVVRALFAPVRRPPWHSTSDVHACCIMKLQPRAV